MISNWSLTYIVKKKVQQILEWKTLYIISALWAGRDYGWWYKPIIKMDIKKHCTKYQVYDYTDVVVAAAAQK
jgi:hypothetical protein